MTGLEHRFNTPVCHSRLRHVGQLLSRHCLVSASLHVTTGLMMITGTSESAMTPSWLYLAQYVSVLVFVTTTIQIFILESEQEIQRKQVLTVELLKIGTKSGVKFSF